MNLKSSPNMSPKDTSATVFPTSNPMACCILGRRGVGGKSLTYFIGQNHQGQNHFDC